MVSPVFKLWNSCSQKDHKIVPNIKGEKLFYFSFSKELSQQQQPQPPQQRKTTHTHKTPPFQITVRDPTADYLTPPLSSNPWPPLMTLLLTELEMQKK